ncbi:hypothetical protein [Desulfatibacillum aliphaticivorans]|uniref:hypothetical protein n=1 Tax=Desulfatibacillum aliphaticivorans TaxID=218208 RepID=UPI0012F90F38|nr:hypothetical protein [Desulfatibacillum aliphaticivorans]
MGNTLTWEFDAETGVYKNRALSGKLLKQSAQKFVFVQFTDKVDDFGKGKGESVTIMHYKNPDTPANNGMLDEHTRIPIDRLETGQVVIQIQEWGRGLEYTSLLKDLSEFDPKNMVQKGLLDQMNRCMDGAAAAAFKQGKIIYIPTSLTGGVLDTDGTPSTIATQNMTKDHVGMISDYMVNDIHVPPFDDDMFVCLATTKALRGLKNDRVLESWHMYLNKGDVLYKREAGKVDQVRFAEVNHENALSNSIGSGGVTGEAVFFGDEAVSRAEVEFPHLRANPNYQGDFGRTKAVAWYGIVAFGPTWQTANDREAKMIRWGSA